MIGSIITLVVLGTIVIFYLNIRSSSTSVEGTGTNISFPGINLGDGNRFWMLIWTAIGIAVAYWIGVLEFVRNLLIGSGAQDQSQTNQAGNVPQSTESLWDTIGTLPIELQLLLAAGAVGLLLLCWWALFGKIWVRTKTDSSGTPIAVNEMHARLRRLALLAIVAAGAALAVSWLAQIDWEQVNIPKLKEVKTDDLWEVVQDNLFKVVLMVGLLLLAAAVVAGSIQHLLTGGKGTKHIVSVTTFLAWVGVLGFVLVVGVGYMLNDDQKGQIKTAVSNTIVSWFQPSDDEAEPRIEGGPKTYFKGDLGGMELGDKPKVGWIRYGDTVTVTNVGGGCLNVHPSAIEMDESLFPAVKLWLGKPGESPITIRRVAHGVGDCR